MKLIAQLLKELGAEEGRAVTVCPGTLAYFRGGPAPRFENSSEQCHLQGALFTIGPDGRCQSVQLVDEA